MLPTHEHVAAYNGYEIYRRRPGFEFTPVMLGKVASFIVRGPGRHVTVFAFMYSLLSGLDDHVVDEAALLAAAARVIEARIDQGQVMEDRHDVTLEYREGDYVEVSSPRWWIPTFA